jgi:hypothetical protein
VEKRIATEEELGAYFDTDLVKGYTDVLATAITSKDDPSVFKGKGYGRGYVDSSGGFHDNDTYLTCTGYIPVKQWQTIYAEGLNFKTDNAECRIIAFNDKFEKVWHTNRGLLLTGTNYHAKYTETANGFSVRIEGDEVDNVHYVRFNFVTTDVSDTPLMAVDEEIKYTVEGFLADGVKVKAENVIGLPEGGSGGGSIDVTAEVGQTIVVKEVDENSKPTAWEAVDLPSGFAMENVVEFVCQEEVTELKVDIDLETMLRINGSPIIVIEFNAEEVSSDDVIGTSPSGAITMGHPNYAPTLVSGPFLPKLGPTNNVNNFGYVKIRFVRLGVNTMHYEYKLNNTPATRKFNENINFGINKYGGNFIKVTATDTAIGVGSRLVIKICK